MQVRHCAALLKKRDAMVYKGTHTQKKRRILDESSPEEVLFSNIQNTREDIVTSVLVASHEVLVREMMVLEFARFCRTHAEHNPLRGA